MIPSKPSTANADGWKLLYPDQAALDAEFTLDTIPDLDAVRARRNRAADRGMAEFPPRGRLPYGMDADETLLFVAARHPAAPGPRLPGRAPALLFFHGGFWSSMQASDFAFLAQGVVPFGGVLVLVDYPLIPRVKLSNVVESCRKALHWVHNHAPEHGIDPQRIFVCGNSAGGHLVAELMDDPSCGFLAGGTAISGLYDLAPVAACFRNELLGLTQDDVAELSPLRRDTRVTKPLIVAVGGRETAEFLRQSSEYAEHLRGGGGRVEHHVVPGADHITIVLDDLAIPEANLNRMVRRQMGLTPL